MQRTPTEWDLRWLWDQPEVCLILSGMSTMEQVVENVAIAGRSAPGTMSPEERDLIPCVFEIYNDLMAYGDEYGAQMVYGWLDEDERAKRFCFSALDGTLHITQRARLEARRNLLLIT